MTEFLFGNRRGYCEQISTALAVMLRTLGIPSREATGYVPGPYNPLTDLYEVQAKDAHAWVQVWFPGYGWQSFDPTASVPLANPSPAAALVHDAKGAFDRLPKLPLVVVLGALLATAAIVGIRRRRPASWGQAITRQLVRAARRGGLEVPDDQPLPELAARVDALWPPGQARPTGGRGPGRSGRAGRLRRGRSRSGGREAAAAGGPAPGPGGPGPAGRRPTGHDAR